MAGWRFLSHSALSRCSEPFWPIGVLTYFRRLLGFWRPPGYSVVSWLLCYLLVPRCTLSVLRPRSLLSLSCKSSGAMTSESYYISRSNSLTWFWMARRYRCPPGLILCNSRRMTDASQLLFEMSSGVLHVSGANVRSSGFSRCLVFPRVQTVRLQLQLHPASMQLPLINDFSPSSVNKDLHTDYSEDMPLSFNICSGK